MTTTAPRGPVARPGRPLVPVPSSTRARPTPRPGRRPTGRRHPAPDRGVAWLWLSAPLAVLTAVAAGAGILVDTTYERDVADFAAQAESQDIVTLLVAVPALAVLWRLAARGSLRARLAWQGVVFYLAYTYAIAAFMVRFNDLFLVYIAILGTAAVALLGSAIGLAPAVTPDDFDLRRWPRRRVATLLGVIVVLFAGLWLADIVPALLDGVRPESLAESATPTNGVEVLDLALLLPGAALAAVWLWRSEVRGLVMATALLAHTALLGLALVAMVIGQVAGDHTDDAAPAILFALLAAAALALLDRALMATVDHRDPAGAVPGPTPTPGPTPSQGPTG